MRRKTKARWIGRPSPQAVEEPGSTGSSTCEKTKRLLYSKGWKDPDVVGDHINAWHGTIMIQVWPDMSGNVFDTETQAETSFRRVPSFREAGRLLARKKRR